jgi:hypothetical protein
MVWGIVTLLDMQNFGHVRVRALVRMFRENLTCENQGQINYQASEAVA